MRNWRQGVRGPSTRPGNAIPCPRGRAVRMLLRVSRVFAARSVQARRRTTSTGRGRAYLAGSGPKLEDAQAGPWGLDHLREIVATKCKSSTYVGARRRSGRGRNRSEFSGKHFCKRTYNPVRTCSRRAPNSRRLSAFDRGSLDSLGNFTLPSVAARLVPE